GGARASGAGRARRSGGGAAPMTLQVRRAGSGWTLGGEPSCGRGRRRPGAVGETEPVLDECLCVCRGEGRVSPGLVSVASGVNGKRASPSVRWCKRTQSRSNVKNRLSP